MNLQKQVLRCHREGLTREETFQRLCSEANLPKVRTRQVLQWFRKMDRMSGINCNLNSTYSNLLWEIYLSFEKTQNTIAAWSPILNNFIRFLDARYALTLCKNDGRTDLCLLDNYYGEMRLLTVTGLDLKDANLYSIEIVDSEYFLLQTRNSGLYLMLLDLPNFNCTFLDTKTLEGQCKKLIFDSTNRHHFCIVYQANYDYWLTRFHIRNSKVIAGRTIQIEYNYYCINCERLVGDRLQTLVGNFTQFAEYNLVEDTGDQTFRKLFDLKTTINVDVITPRKHVWHRDICYIFGSKFRSVKFHLCVFDLETRSFGQINCTYLNVNPEFDMHVDEDGSILTVCTQVKDSCFVRRFSMGRPEKLKDLALFMLRKCAIFYGSFVYDQIAPNFPPNLRPFSISNEC